MLQWLKKKSVERSKSNISIILNNLALVCQALDDEIRANGGAPVTLGPTFQLLMQQRHELYFQLNGPMSMDEVRGYVEPFLESAPLVRLAVEATIAQYEENLPP